MYNLISCSGFVEEGVGGWVASAPCLKARLGLVILFFIVALVRKWGGEEFGLDFSFLFALIGGLGGYIVLITIFGSLKIAMIAGLLLSLAFGYGFGMFFGGDDY